MKGYDASGFVFGTSYASAKGAQLAVNPRAALVFPWHALQRQVRVDRPGRADRRHRVRRPLGPAARAAPSWPPSPRCSRPSSTRARSWSSGCGCSTSRRRPGQVPRPAVWGGYRVVPGAGGVLAGRRRPAARPAGVRAGRRGGRRLDRAAARPVTSTASTRSRAAPGRRGSRPPSRRRRRGSRSTPRRCANPPYRRLFGGVAATMLGAADDAGRRPVPGLRADPLVAARRASPRSSRWCR